MTAYIIAAGIACIAYACWRKRRLDRFKDILEKESYGQNGMDESARYGESDSGGMESLRLRLGEMEIELADLRKSNESMENRLAAMERIFEDFTGTRSRGRVSPECGNPKFREMLAGQYDFEGKSLDELSSETGLKKGELILLKRLSRK